MFATIDESGIGMNLAENLSRVSKGGENSAVGEAFTNASTERWCIDFKILFQRRDLGRTGRGRADRFWAIVLASQKERGPKWRWSCG